MSRRAWLLIVSMLVSSLCWGAADQGNQDVRELFEIMGLKQHVVDAGPQLEAAARASVDEAIAKLGAKSLSSKQRALLDDARTQLSAVAKASLVELETKVVEAFAGSFTQGELQTLLEFARTDTGRSLFKRLVEAGAEGKEIDISTFTPVEMEALHEWALKPDFGTMIEKFPTMEARLTQAVDLVMKSIEDKLTQIATELATKL
jgi:hypothetical protein